MRRYYNLIGCLLLCICPFLQAMAQESPQEEDFFEIKRVRVPEGILLEVGGLTTLPNGNLGISTRRGDVYIVENPTSNTPYFRKFASGLHEILGLAWKDGALYCAQRGELTRLVDTDMDGKADLYETVYAWPITGNYHEYSYGPAIAPDGSFFVTTNVGFWGEQWWRGDSRAPWRGWTMRITPDGKMQPWAAGMRSPAGLGFIDGELFYTENQGDWIGSGGIWHLRKGDFTGNPAGLKWAHLPESPVPLTYEEFVAEIDIREEKRPDGRYIKPENIQNEQNYLTDHGVQKVFPAMRLPAVWLPHGILGISNSEPLKIPEGHFGPFEGQILVADQGMSMISRVFLEKVNGEYQGAAFGFRSGFRSGVLRMAWAPDGSLFAGETNRGWGSAGDSNEGLERLVWNGKIPFEMKAVRAMPDGFEIEFTMPADPVSAGDLASYSVVSHTYKYHPVYGSPPVDQANCEITGVKLSEDGLRARIVVENLRPHYVHTISLEGVREKDHYYSLVHPTAYYTLHAIPSGRKLTASEVSTRDSSIPEVTPSAESESSAKKPGSKPKASAGSSGKASADKSEKPAINMAEIKGLLAKHTCVACHNADKRQVGPAYKDIAARKYSDKEIVELIHNPKPENWPDYATEMPPMAHVPEADALKIAAYINSLAK